MNRRNAAQEAPPAPQVWREATSRCIVSPLRGSPTPRSGNAVKRNGCPQTWGAGGAFFLLLLAFSAPAAPPPAPSAETVTMDAGAGQWLNAPRTLQMSGGVTFKQGDATLQTSAAIVNLDDRQRALNAKSAASVRLTDPQDDLTGASGFVDFTRHLATVSGSVILVIKPGKREANAPASSPRKNFTDPATMTCDEMTYNYKTKQGTVPGPLTVKQTIARAGTPLQRTLTAEGATYDGKAQTVTLTGTVRSTDSDGNALEVKAVPGRGVVLGIAEGAESVTSPVPLHAVFKVKDEADDTPPPAPSKKP